jgi:hypothetical protein
MNLKSSFLNGYDEFPFERLREGKVREGKMSEGRMLRSNECLRRMSTTNAARFVRIDRGELLFDL